MNFDWSGQYTWLAPKSIQVPSQDLSRWRFSASIPYLGVHENAKIWVFSSLAATIAVSDLSFFFCLGPWPYFPPPLAQQSSLVCPFFLQFPHWRSDLSVLESLALPPFYFPPFLVWAASAVSAILVCSLFISLCWASSMMNEIKKPSAFIWCVLSLQMFNKNVNSLHKFVSRSFKNERRD